MRWEAAYRVADFVHGSDGARGVERGLHLLSTQPELQRSL